MAPKGGPKTPKNCRIYAVGDIHGRADLLDTLLARIAEDAAARPAVDREVMIFLGDYVNRGPGTRQVVDTLLDGIPDGFEAHYLKGNHEAVMAWFLESPSEFFTRWIGLGGKATMESYGVDVESLTMGPDYDRRCWEAFNEAIPARHRDFFRDLRLFISIGDYFFVHGGVRPEVPLDAQVEEDMLWIKDDFLSHEAPFEKVIVHGHTPLDAPEIKPNRLSLDTRAWFSGCLTAVRLEGPAQELLMTRPAL